MRQERQQIYYAKSGSRVFAHRVDSFVSRILLFGSNQPEHVVHREECHRDFIYPVQKCSVLCSDIVEGHGKGRDKIGYKRERAYYVVRLIETAVDDARRHHRKEFLSRFFPASVILFHLTTGSSFASFDLFVLFDLLDLCRLHSTTNHAGTVPDRPALYVSALVFEFLQAVFYTAESDLQKFFRNIMTNGYISRRPAIIRMHMTVFVNGDRPCTSVGAPIPAMVLPVLVSIACEIVIA